MKKFKWIAIGLAAVVVIGLIVGWISLDSIVRRTVETQATKSLDLQTTLGGASVSIFGGNVSLSDLSVASPQGFSAPQMFSLGGIHVDTSLGELRGDPIGISSIQIDKPMLVIEQANGKLNFQVLMDKQSAQPPDSGKPGDGQRDETEPMRLIIQQMAVNNAQVVLRPGIPGLEKEINVNIPSFQLNSIGTADGNQNGAAIKEVVMLLVTTLADKAKDSDALPPEVRQLLAMDVNQLKGRVEQEVGKQIGKVQEEISKQVPGDAGKEIGKAVEQGLGGLLNQNRPATRPR